MKKNFTFTGSGETFDTRELAVEAAKKSMEGRYTRTRSIDEFGYRTTRTLSTDDIIIYEGVACVKFPIPNYEVVELASS